MTSTDATAAGTLIGNLIEDSINFTNVVNVAAPILVAFVVLALVLSIGPNWALGMLGRIRSSF